MLGRAADGHRIHHLLSLYFGRRRRDGYRAEVIKQGTGRELVAKNNISGSYDYLYNI